MASTYSWNGLQDTVIAHTIRLMVSEERQRLPAHSRLLLVVTISVTATLALGIWFWHNVQSKQSANTLPAAVTQQINSFKPYYLKPTFTTDFSLQQNTVKYQYGVLVFSLMNSTGKTISITEEATPSQFDTSTLQTTKQFNTEYGQAVITDGSDRTTGALFTSDKTWVVINAPRPIGADLMQQFLDALTPVKK